MFDTLISVPELAQRLEAPALVILDCRFDLARPAWGEAAYAEAHIRNAHYAHLDRDLSGALRPDSGRHPLPEPQALAARLGGWGIAAGVQVVAYDQGHGAFAARLWWLLRWLGHPAVAVLDGGFTAWQAAGLEVETTAPPAAHPRPFEGRPHTDEIITTAQLEQWLAAGALRSGEHVLIDARGADRFAGRNETIDPVAGHIPGAHNHPFTDNLADGRFLPAAALRERYLRTLGERRPEQLVCMCGSGVTACHTLLALQIAGLPGARLYGGSWSEWIRDPAHPVATGG
ncbi:MAG: sulfurtransferase [Steroidobacteraceae bacterium]